jgi:hypothetical protein
MLVFLCVILNVCHALFESELNYDQILSFQSVYKQYSGDFRKVLPFNSAVSDGLFDANGHCFVLLTDDNLMWSSRETIPAPPKVQMKNLYSDWIQVSDLNDLQTSSEVSPFHLIKAPDSIILVSSSLIVEVVMDYFCTKLVSVVYRTPSDMTSWGRVLSLAISANRLWIGSEAGVLEVTIDFSTNGFWSLNPLGSIPDSDIVTSLLWVDGWETLFISTKTVFYELNYSQPSNNVSVKHEWIGGNLDTPIVSMIFDSIHQCVWATETNALHKRDSRGLWWRQGYPQGAVTDNVTTVSTSFRLISPMVAPMVERDGSNEEVASFVWLGTRERGVARLRLPSRSLTATNQDSSWTAVTDEYEYESESGVSEWDRWLLYDGPRYLPDSQVILLLSDHTSTETEASMRNRRRAQQLERDKTTYLIAITLTGVTFLSLQPWSLREKESAMRSFQYPRHDRLGISSEVSLHAYGDLTSFYHTPLDSDGIWTAQYAVAASVRYSFR